MKTETLIKIKAMAVKKGTTQNKIIRELDFFLFLVG